VGPIDWSTGLGIVTGDLFLRNSRTCLTLLGQRESLPRTACHGRVHVMRIKFSA
jgi:hypothetical protein